MHVTREGDSDGTMRTMVLQSPFLLMRTHIAESSNASGIGHSWALQVSQPHMLENHQSTENARPTCRSQTTQGCLIYLSQTEGREEVNSHETLHMLQQASKFGVHCASLLLADLEFWAGTVVARTVTCCDALQPAGRVGV